METANSGFIKTPFINLQSDFGFKRADIVGEEMVRYSESLDRLRSYQAGVDYAAEKSRLEGIQEGMEKGIEKGVEKVAMRLIKSGMDDMLIASMTDLSLEQIKRLRAR
ncbi:MAG: hypothetical protein HDS67_09220 [Bacteroidales bacterium]|nr:hypothetical protein [Bacteroidales bacterium]